MKSITSRDFGGLDFVRSVLLFLGVALHATPDIQHGYRWIGIISYLFRMEAFFVISGFLSASALSQPKTDKWVQKRMLSLGVPVLTLWTISLGVNVIQRISGASSVDRLEISIRHEWFLIVLLGCTLLGTRISMRKLQDRILSLTGINDREITRKPFVNLLTLMFFSRVLLLSIKHMINYSIKALHSLDYYYTSKALAQFAITIGKLPYYFVFFTLGFMLFNNKTFFDYVDSMRHLTVAILIVVLVAVFIFYTFAPDEFHPYYSYFMQWNPWLSGAIFKSATSGAACLALMPYALKLTRTSGTFKDISGASFTVYVTHIFVIMLVKGLAIRNGLDGWLLFGTTTLLTIIICFGFHFLLVDRFKLVAFFVNGRTKSLQLRLKYNRIYAN